MQVGISLDEVKTDMLTFESYCMHKGVTEQHYEWYYIEQDIRFKLGYSKRLRCGLICLHIYRIQGFDLHC